MLNCGSVVALTMKCFKLDLPASKCLASLKTMLLSGVILVGDTMKHLISSCPLLEDLVLGNCNVSENLNIYAANSRLKKLSLVDDDYSGPAIESGLSIFAPNVTTLHCSFDMRRKSYHVEDLSSLVDASFDFREPLIERTYYDTKFVELLDQIHHVKKLSLRNVCTVDISVKETSGSENSVSSLPFSVPTLDLAAGFCMYELPGISYIFKRFVNLEDLVISIEDEYRSSMFEEYLHDEYDFNETEYWMSIDSYFSALPHIKTVKINGFVMGSEYNEEIDAICIEIESTEDGFKIEDNSIAVQARIEKLSLNKIIFFGSSGLCLRSCL